MRKIGILTFSNAINYGAILQTYALQYYLSSKVEGSVEVINYYTKFNKQELNPIQIKSSNFIKNILLKIYGLIFYIPLKRRINLFVQFRMHYINFSRQKYESEDKLINHIAKYDVYVSGSDQVFHPRIKDWRVYYLGFQKGSSRKVAYAPSFGISQITEQERNMIKPYLYDFDALSSREAEGVNIIFETLGLNVPQVCDPVFLMTADEWSKISVKPHIKHPYILVYDLNGGKNLLSIVNKIRNKTCLDVVWLTSNILNRFKECKIVNDAGPREFIGYIENAEYVVTDSFHGTSFSLIFGKKVIPYIALQSASSRLNSLMSICGISERIIFNTDDNIIMSDLPPDYKQKLYSFIKSSKIYLQNNVIG